MVDWSEAEETQIRTVGELRRFLDRFGPAEKVFITDGDRTFYVTAAFCRIKGQDHPGKRWDEFGVMLWSG